GRGGGGARRDGPAAGARRARAGRLGRGGTGGEGRPGGAALPAPRRGAGGVVDTHAHLASCEAEPAELVAAARAAGVERIVTIGTGRASSEQALALADPPGQGLRRVG